MTRGQEQLMRDLTEAVDVWCPPQFEHEGFAERALRAFLNARACVFDQKRVLDGKPPIRPLLDYPIHEDPLAKF